MGVFNCFRIKVRFVADLEGRDQLLGRQVVDTYEDDLVDVVGVFDPDPGTLGIRWDRDGLHTDFLDERRVGVISLRDSEPDFGLAVNNRAERLGRFGRDLGVPRNDDEVSLLVRVRIDRDRAEAPYGKPGLAIRSAQRRRSHP